MTIQNAKIYRVRLGNFEGRFWGGQICFSYDSCGQCAFVPIIKIGDVLKILSVNFWEELPGTPCRVKANLSHIEAIGNFVKDNWLEL